MVQREAAFPSSLPGTSGAAFRRGLFAFAVVFALSPLGAAPAEEHGGGNLLGGVTANQAYDAEQLLRLAEQGDARAAFLLGTRFASGRGGARDDSEAFRWFEQAAEAGLAEAQYNLGVMFASGRGVARNLAAAARWYGEAANQGIAEAQFNIGTFYALGTGVEKDEVRAAEWLTRAANKSLPQAQFNLGVLHEHGRGVRTDVRVAMAWYRRAAEQGYDPAKQRLQALGAKLGPPPASMGVALVEAASTAGGSDSERIAGLDPAQYTLQLLSDTDESNVRRFVAANVDPGSGGYFSSRINGRLWYSVVYGTYPSVESARAAIEDLPPALRRLKPWVRKVANVQQQMIR